MENQQKEIGSFTQKPKNLFCFCCILFGKVFQGKQMSHLANHKREFSDWKHLYRLEEHENSPEHRNSYLELKFLEKRLKTGGTIDGNLQKAIQSERKSGGIC
jgi:hypothetical protein